MTSQQSRLVRFSVAVPRPVDHAHIAVAWLLMSTPTVVSLPVDSGLSERASQCRNPPQVSWFKRTKTHVRESTIGHRPKALDRTRRRIPRRLGRRPWRRARRSDSVR